MATVKALIRTTKKEGKVNIRFRLSDGRDIQLFHVSDIQVEIPLWDSKKECIKARAVCKTEYRLAINKAIDDRKALILEIYEANKPYLKDSSSFEEAIDKILHPKAEKRVDLFSIFEEYIMKYKVGSTEWKNHKSLERILYRYQGFVRLTEKPKFELPLQMDRETLEGIFDYIKNEYTLIQESPKMFERLLAEYPFANIQRKTSQVEERSENTCIKIKERLKAFFSWCVAEGLLKENPFGNIKIGCPVNGTPYYITVEERDRLSNFDLSRYPTLEAQRDIFVFQCLTGCRVGDLLKLTNANIVEGALVYMPHKTLLKNGNVLRVPLHERALAILRKYRRKGDNEPILPFISAQKYNDAIKRIFTICGLRRMVVILDPKTREPKNVPINEVASSHLARRTFCGNLYRQVKDPNLIGKLSGHSEGSRAFSRYRSIDEQMKVDLINML